MRKYYEGKKYVPEDTTARGENSSPEAEFLIRDLGSINGDDLKFNSFRGKSITRSFILTRDTY